MKDWIRILFPLALLWGTLGGQPAERFPAAEWPRGTPSEFRMDESRLAAARDYALQGGGSGVVIHRGKLVYAWGDQEARYDLKSTTKSIGVTAVGLAVRDGKIRLHDTAEARCPGVVSPMPSGQYGNSGDKITFLHLAAQTAGFDKPGGFQPLLFEPGTRWSYSDSGPNYLADCLTAIYGRDLRELLFERVLTPLGITRQTLTWRENQYRPKTMNGVARREFGSGIHATVDAMARIGFLYNRAGRINSRQVLPPDFVAVLRQPIAGARGLPVLKSEQYPEASNHYGLLWWNNADGRIAGVPRDAFWSWGLYDRHIVVIPSLDLVAARAGRAPDGGSGALPSRLEPFLRPLAEAVDAAGAQVRAPYPPSPVVEAIEWAPVETIHRTGSDCDNLPTAWADDGELYTAHGDCYGFEPLRPRKLGLGFAKITGVPLAARGINIPSASADNTGMGAEGKKASGLLMVDGVLYMWARNAGNSQLAWSTDHAKTWTWSGWKFTVSFGHPAFLSFGRNYADARDGFVYVYSPDEDSAYIGAARLVMARVPKNRIREREAYEFFAGVDAAAQPRWTRDISRREAVFSNPPRGVYRSQVSYNPGLKRYFLNQILIGSDYVRFQGGFGVYDAPDPWGPWTTSFFTAMWDVGPGENNHFPPKWMSPDGKTMHLIFSGDDVFSVRKAVLRLRRRTAP